MLKLLLLIGASLTPALSFSHEDRGGHEADLFRVPSAEEPRITLEQLIGQEPVSSNRATSAFQAEQGSKVEMTTLRNAAGVATTAFLYSVVSGAEDEGYICRIRIDPQSEVGFSRTMKWCLSFIDPSSRPTISISPSKP